MVLYSRHFLWHTVSTTSSSKKLDDFSPWCSRGSDSPWRKSGCGHPPVPLLLQHVSKDESLHTCFSENSNGLVSQQLLLYFTYVSLSHSLQGRKHMNQAFVQSGSLGLNPRCPRDTHHRSLPDTMPVGDRAHFVPRVVMKNMESHL